MFGNDEWSGSNSGSAKMVSIVNPRCVYRLMTSFKAFSIVGCCRFSSASMVPNFSFLVCVMINGMVLMNMISTTMSSHGCISSSSQGTGSVLEWTCGRGHRTILPFRLPRLGPQTSSVQMMSALVTGQFGKLAMILSISSWLPGYIVIFWRHWAARVRLISQYVYLLAWSVMVSMKVCPFTLSTCCRLDQNVVMSVMDVSTCL